MIWLVVGVITLTVWATVVWWLNTEPEPTQEWRRAQKGRVLKQNATSPKPEKRYL